MNNSEPNPVTFLQENKRASARGIPQADASRRASREFRFWQYVYRLSVLLAIAGLAAVLGGTLLLAHAEPFPVNANESVPAKVVAPAVIHISIRNLQFSPRTIEVKKDDAIEWKNNDIVPHTATSASFDSGPILSGQSWRHTFPEAGKFPYACTFHPLMKATVIVK